MVDFISNKNLTAQRCSTLFMSSPCPWSLIKAPLVKFKLFVYAVFERTLFIEHYILQSQSVNVKGDRKKISNYLKMNLIHFPWFTLPLFFQKRFHKKGGESLISTTKTNNKSSHLATCNNRPNISCLLGIAYVYSIVLDPTRWQA